MLAREFNTPPDQVLEWPIAFACAALGHLTYEGNLREAFLEEKRGDAELLARNERAMRMQRGG